jgi:hypothetical protein
MGSCDFKPQCHWKKKTQKFDIFVILGLVEWLKWWSIRP